MGDREVCIHGVLATRDCGDCAEMVADEIEELAGELADAKSQLRDLRSERDQLRADLEKAREQLRLANIDAVNAQSDLEQLEDDIAEYLPAYYHEDAAGGGLEECNAREKVESAGADIREFRERADKAEADLAAARHELALVREENRRLIERTFFPPDPDVLAALVAADEWLPRMRGIVTGDIGVLPNNWTLEAAEAIDLVRAALAKLRGKP